MFREYSALAGFRTFVAREQLQAVGSLLRQIIEWAAIAIFPFVFIALMDHVFGEISNAESAWRVDTGRVIHSQAVTSSQLPIDGWSDISFPSVLSSEATGPLNVWYRLPLIVSDEQQELWSVYVRDADGNYAVFVNGQFAAESSPMTQPLPLLFGPLILKFPGVLLKSGLNTIDVRTARAASTKTLQQFNVGPVRSLSPVYDLKHLLIVSIREATVIALLMMSAIMSAMFRLRTRDAALGWFAISFFVWAVYLSIKLNPQWPNGHPIFLDNLENVLIGTFVMCAATFAQRFLGITRSVTDKIFSLWLMLGIMVLLAGPIVLHSDIRWFFDILWFPPLVLAAIYVCWLFLREFQRFRSVEMALLFAVSWCGLIVGVSDHLVGFGLLDVRPPYLVYTAGLFLLIFGSILLRRFTRAISVAERSRVELEIRVHEKTKELEMNVVRIKDMERENALSAERERIMRDMHDGVGGQLVQALSIARGQPEFEPIEEVLLNCLEELRLIVDSIEPVNGDLGSVLGTMRLRMARRLAAVGVRIHWRVHDLPPMDDLGPKRVLDVLRIVQEAVANSLKHARASNITIGADFRPSAIAGEPSFIVVEIADDGHGVERLQESGHGLKNMRHRAESMGGRLQVSSTSSGTTVQLLLRFAGSPIKVNWRFEPA